LLVPDVWDESAVHGGRVFLDALRLQAEAYAAWVRGGEATGATAADAVAALAAAEQAEGQI
jgi:hypothetical protein